MHSRWSSKKQSALPLERNGWRRPLTTWPVQRSQAMSVAVITDSESKEFSESRGEFRQPATSVLDHVVGLLLDFQLGLVYY